MKFERYDSYKDSGIEWLGKIPSEWILARIKDFTYVKGRIGWQGLRNEDFLAYGEYYCVTGTDFYNKTIDWSKCYYVDYDRYSQDRFIQLHENDLLVTKDGSIGKLALIDSLPKPATLNSGVFVTRPLRKKYENKYMYWFLFSNVFTQFIDLNKNGSTILHLYQNVFDRFIYTIPNINMQIKIADYLDTKTQKIDNEISLLEQKIKKYQELKQILIKETILRGLDKDVELKDSEIDWIGNIPKHWTTDRLKNIFDERVAKNLDKNTGEAITTNILSVMKDVGVINHRDKGNVGNKMAEDITNYKLVYPNDIVVNKMNVMIGSVGISKEFGSLSVIYIILITKKNHYAKYYDYFFKIKAFQRSLRRIATGILEIREAVNMTLFMQESMTAPSYEEQVQIANYLDEKTTKIDEIVKTIGTKIEVLKEFRKTLINDVVTGKVKVV